MPCARCGMLEGNPIHHGAPGAAGSPGHHYARPDAMPPQFDNPPETALRGLAVKAREACGCMQCEGGYEIGARTIAAGVPDVSRPAAPPTSCLASVILEELIRYGREKGAAAARAKRGEKPPATPMPGRGAS